MVPTLTAEAQFDLQRGRLTIRDANLADLRTLATTMWQQMLLQQSIIRKATARIAELEVAADLAPYATVPTPPRPYAPTEARATPPQAAHSQNTPTQAEAA